MYSGLSRSKEFHAARFSQDHRLNADDGAADICLDVNEHGQHAGAEMGGRNDLSDGEIRDGMHAARSLEPDHNS